MNVMAEAVMAALALSVAAGYFTIAAVVAPRIRMPSAGDGLLRVVRIAAIAFFIGCGMTHVHILVHTLGYGTAQPVEAHELVFHSFQAVGAWLFVLGAILRLELQVVPAQSRAELKAAVEHQRRRAERAQELAERDELTGLARRYRFDEELARTTAQVNRYRSPAALLLVDVDGLKAVNDSHGHPAGDALLARLGKRIRTALRATDLAARIGGDELAIILPETEMDEAEVVARKVVDLLGEEAGTSENGRGPAATVSVGVAEVQGLPAEVMASADAALYRAKRAGGARYAVARLSAAAAAD
jgi:diguanylate cyclase (GGDEF)-like protein